MTGSFGLAGLPSRAGQPPEPFGARALFGADDPSEPIEGYWRIPQDEELADTFQKAIGTAQAEGEAYQRGEQPLRPTNRRLAQSHERLVDGIETLRAGVRQLRRQASRRF